jgi:hypothetical protein
MLGGVRGVKANRCPGGVRAHRQKSFHLALQGFESLPTFGHGRVTLEQDGKEVGGLRVEADRTLGSVTGKWSSLPQCHFVRQRCRQGSRERWQHLGAAGQGVVWQGPATLDRVAAPRHICSYRKELLLKFEVEHTKIILSSRNLDMFCPVDTNVGVQGVLVELPGLVEENEVPLEYCLPGHLCWPS